MYTLEQITSSQLENNSINAQLYELYQANWDALQTAIFNETDVANPYLISATNDYMAAKKKIMIFGQETLGWGGEFYDAPQFLTIENLMKLYNQFVNTDGGYNSPFWSFVSKLKNAQNNLGCITNNIVKIGKKFEPGCDNNINKLALEYFNVCYKEIKIADPDIMIFLTGPRYDEKIKLTLGDFDIIPIGKFTNRQFAKLQFSDNSLPVAYRCYHPGYLRRSGMEKIVLDELLKRVCFPC